MDTVPAGTLAAARVGSSSASARRAAPLSWVFLLLHKPLHEGGAAGRIEHVFEDLPDDDPRITALIAAERAAAAAYLACNDALLELWASTPAGDRVGRRPQVLAEAGLALGLHPVSVEARLGVALSLQDHPLLRAQLADGRLGVAHVLVAVELVGTLGDEDLGDRVLHAVLAAAEPDGESGWDGTPSELRRALQRAAVRIDPLGAARRREEQTAARTGVRLRPLPDGLAAWVATGSAAQLLAADRLLDVASRPSDPDDPRTRGQRQVDALLGALLSRVGTGAPLELQLEVPVTVTETAPVRGCAPEPVAIRAELTPELLALLAADTAPADSPPAATPAAPPAAAPPAIASPVMTARGRLGRHRMHPDPPRLHPPRSRRSPQHFRGRDVHHPPGARRPASHVGTVVRGRHRRARRRCHEHGQQHRQMRRSDLGPLGWSTGLPADLPPRRCRSCWRSGPWTSGCWPSWSATRLGSRWA